MGNKNDAAERAEKGITLIAVGTVIAILGLILCSLTVTKYIGSIPGEPMRFAGEGLIISGIGTVVWSKGAARYLKAALELGYTDDSI